MNGIAICCSQVSLVVANHQIQGKGAVRQSLSTWKPAALGFSTPFNFSWRFCLWSRWHSPFECGKRSILPYSAAFTCMKGMTVIVLMWEEAAIKDDVIEYDIAFNIIYIMRTNGKDGRIWRESLTLAVNWLLSTVIQNHPFLQTNQNQMSVSSK